MHARHCTHGRFLMPVLALALVLPLASIPARGAQVVTEVVHGPTGVCWYSVVKFPPGADPSIRPVPVFSTETFMTAPLQVCPKQDDPRFYRADGVSERVFLALLELATSLSSSDEGFDAAFATPRNQMSFDQQREVSEMRGDILFGDPITRSRYVLRVVGLRGPAALPHQLVVEG
jgi:hypothetical protein